MQPDQEIAGTNLSVNRLAIRRALNATGNEAEGVDQEIMRLRDVLVHQGRYDPLEFRHTHLSSPQSVAKSDFGPDHQAGRIASGRDT